MQTATPEDVGFSTERLKRIDPAMRRLVDAGVISGAVTLIARHGKIAYFETCGKQDIEANRPMARDTIFRIYSMTKPITAIATLLLYEEGHFLLDDPVSRFIPEFANTKVFARKVEGTVQVADLERPITIRHLLMHMSGLPYPNPSGSPVARSYAQEHIMRDDESLEAKMRRVAELPLVHQPGSAWTYGISHDVLGRVVEVVSGRPFPAFLAERIFAPLGMVDTGFVVPRRDLDRLTAVYSSEPTGSQRRVDGPQFDRSEPRPFVSGGGGLVSTASDYARFAQMLVNGGELAGTRLLGRKTVELFSASPMSREEIPFIPPGWACREGYGMALGVRTLVDLAKSGSLGSVGMYTWQGAAGTDFWVDPQEDLIAMVMVQGWPGPTRPGEMLRALVYQALLD